MGGDYSSLLKTSVPEIYLNKHSYKVWVSRYLDNILKGTQDKYHIFILFSPGLGYIIRECQCDLIRAVFSMTLNYKPIKIIFYVYNYYVRD